MQLRQSERLSAHGGGRRGRGRSSGGASDAGGSGNDDGSGSSSGEDTDGSDDSSSDEEDDRDRTAHVNEGCSQRNLYGTMRLSFVVAMLHVFVLVSLHATYVGPYAFRRQTMDVVAFSQRWRRLARRMDLDEVRFPRGLIPGGDEPGDDVDERDTTTLINCISYALATRPVKDRSTYFGEEKADSSSDGDGDGTKRGLRSY